MALYKEHAKVVQLLLDWGADPNEGLYWASRNGQLKFIQLLLDRGANVEAVASDGETPLYSASEHGHVKVVQLLLEKVANINT